MMSLGKKDKFVSVTAGGELLLFEVFLQEKKRSQLTEKVRKKYSLHSKYECNAY